MKLIVVFLGLISALWGAPAELNFLAVGDWGRDGKDGQRETAEQMGRTAKACDSQFVLSVGDNFYQTGVKTVTDSRWRSSFEDVYTAKTLQRPWYVALGNHDYKTSPQAQVDYTPTSSRWRMPSRYYTWTAKVDESTTVQFFCIDTSPFITAYQKHAADYGDLAAQSTAAQLAWLERELAASHADWKIVFGHHPIYSAGIGHGDTPELIAQLKPILEKNGVQLYICGHDHDLQFLRDEGPLRYFVSGAGSQVKGTGRSGRTIYANGKVSGFLHARLEADRAQVEFIDATGVRLFVTDIPRIYPKASTVSGLARRNARTGLSALSIGKGEGKCSRPGGSGASRGACFGRGGGR